MPDKLQDFWSFIKIWIQFQHFGMTVVVVVVYSNNFIMGRKLRQFLLLLSNSKGIK